MTMTATATTRPVPSSDGGTVLVLGNYRPALTVVRALATRGLRTMVGLGGHEGGVEYSRFAHESWDHAPLTGTGRAFMDALLRLLAARPDITTVYPIAEEFCACLAMHGHRLPDRVVVATVDRAVFDFCQDKVRMLTFAKELQVGCEPFAVVTRYDRLLQEARDIGFPIVIRPLTQRVKLGGKKALICRDEDELRAELPAWPQGQHALLLQRQARGIRHNVFFAARRGEILRSLETQIHRTDQRDGTGYAVDGVTVAPTPHLHAECRRMARALNYTGVGLAQFIIDPETGRSCFLELNPRIAGSHAIADAAGQELSLLALKLARDDLSPQDLDPWDYRAGIRYAWTYGDLRGLKSALLAGDITSMQAVGWCVRSLVAGLRADVHMTWCWDDPAPTCALFARQTPGIRRLVDCQERPIMCEMPLT
ncbi:MAG: hypothetical protein MI824_03115 [Hyphomicrobiales bacterium]|nr:hypothetical protein [Hyphomicrobiales bacterium]